MNSWKALIAAVILTAGCAGPQAYLIKVGLDPAAAPPRLPAGTPVTVSLVPFADMRPDKTLGTRTRHSGVTDTYVTQEGLSSDITEAAREWLAKAGCSVTEASPWDGASASLKNFHSDLVIGGTIEKFTVETKTGFAGSKTTAAAAITVVIGRTKDLSVTTKKVETTAETEIPGFSPVDAEKAATDALTQALTKALSRLP